MRGDEGVEYLVARPALPRPLRVQFRLRPFFEALGRDETLDRETGLQRREGPMKLLAPRGAAAPHLIDDIG